jgi:uncharacterized membrane protein YhdT
MNIRDIPNIVIALATAGLLTAFCLQILVETRDSADAYTIWNETHTFANDTCAELTYNPMINLIGISNGTDMSSVNDVEVGGGSWFEICQRDIASVKGVFNLSQTAGAYNVTYSTRYSRGTASLSNVTTGVSEFATWFETMGLVLAAAIVIGVVVLVYKNIFGEGGY